MRLPPRSPSAPSEPTIRRLGVKSSAHLERPIRAQAILGFFALFLALAIPVYLMRRPQSPPEKSDAAAPLRFSPSVPSAPAPSAEDERLNLGEAELVKCASNPGSVGQSGRLCDHLPYFEKALGDAIKNSLDCAPRTRDGGTLNYVLKVDFNLKKLHVFPGASGTWKGPQARHATKCVKQGLTAPEWDKLDHKHRYYEIAVMATYKPPPPTAAPVFE